MTPKSPVLDEVSGIWESGSPPARLLQLHTAVKQTKRFFADGQVCLGRLLSLPLSLLCSRASLSLSARFNHILPTNLASFGKLCVLLRRPSPCMQTAGVGGTALGAVRAGAGLRLQLQSSNLAELRPQHGLALAAVGRDACVGCWGDVLARKPTSFPGGIGAPSSSTPLSSKLSKCRPFRTASVWDLQPEMGTGQLGSCSHHLPPKC